MVGLPDGMFYPGDAGNIAMMFAFIKDAVAKRLKGERPGMLRALLVALLIGIAAAVVAYKLLRARVGTPIDSPKNEISSRARQTRPEGSGKVGVGGLTDNKRLEKAPRRLRRRAPPTRRWGAPRTRSRGR
jgi:hypothetical protein